ncbi:7-cyano-7-deazaguanine synthase [uncultured delta proteobacterium]|uniref:7-cyano-7-deazaguanine synthase n=1 Tax=uncultured delta proteobacterium TaxID=34034 RepID=A0A212KEJ8_9DELT|nr:7-cyano-7-deazaguanine synthase [uncultured delta proteobacterium]
MTRAFISFSGGIDSTTLLAHMLAEGYQVTPVFFAYGSKHGAAEEAAARNVCRHYGVTCPVVDLTGIFDLACSDSALMARMPDREIPSGDQGYREPGSLDATVVPGRNTLFASVLLAFAEAEALRTGQQAVIAMGIHAGDHTLYPDCREPFFTALGNAFDLGTEKRVKTVAPFVRMDKSAIVKRGLELGAPYHLSWSCYKGGTKACGVCGTCRERLKAFADAGIADPIEYEAR